MDTHIVISAFLDNEPFDPADLARALADPEGRELLLDLVALHTLVKDDSGVAALAPSTRTTVAARRSGIALGFLAASVIFAAASLLFLPSLRQPSHDVPPKPDHVVTFDISSNEQP